MKLPEHVKLFIVTGGSGSGKSTLSQKVDKLMSDIAVFDMDLIVDNNNFQAACLNWMKIAYWRGLHGKSTILFGNVPYPYNVTLSMYFHSFKTIKYLHLHCNRQERSKRLLGRGFGWTPDNLEPELSLADSMLEKCLRAKPKIPVIDTSMLSISECAGKIAKWVESNR